jgi:hypothetical protein
LLASYRRKQDMAGQLQPQSAEKNKLADRLRQLAHGREALDVAQFQFVSLEEIRSAYGERWAEQRARIRDTAETYLRSRMDASDLLISAGGGFVVVFGAAAGAEAAVAAGQLSHSLNEFFLGNAGSDPAPRFGFTSHSVPVKELASSLGDLDFITPEAAPEPAEIFGLPQVEWRFQPVWDVKRETLSNWYVAPYLKKTQARLPGYQFENLPVRASEFAAVDEAGLRVSEQAIQELISQGKQALVGVSLHARTLTNDAARARIISVLDRLDRQLFRYRVVKIAGVAPGFPRLYLNEIVRLLKARVQNVVIGAAWDEPDLAGLLQAGPVAVGATFPQTLVGAAAGVTLQTLLVKLGKDIQRAHLAKLRFFVEGDVPSAVAMKLASIGVDNISSSQIWPAMGTPDAMLKWPATRLAA